MCSISQHGLFSVDHLLTMFCCPRHHIHAMLQSQLWPPSTKPVPTPSPQPHPLSTLMIPAHALHIL
jgi:hypothetical protein